GHPPARFRVPGGEPAADLPAGGDPLGRALHRDRDAHRHGVVVHEHHPGRDPGGGFGHRLPAAAVVGAAADQPHLRRAAHHLRARLRFRPPVPHTGRPHAVALHVVYCFDLRGGRMKTVIAALLLVVASAAQGQALKKVVLFGQPSVNNDAIWMAIEYGYFKEQGLDLEYRVFPSGTTAFQTFRTGQGDIVMTGDLPSVQYFFNNPGQYQTFVAIERDAKGYVVIARKDIRSAKDLVGKPVATRVGSTGSW